MCVWEVCVVPSLPAHSFLPFLLRYLVPVVFSCRAARRRLFQDGLTLVSVPALIKEPSVEHPPTRVLKIVNEWLKQSRRAYCH